jgi:hypothetical protein
MYCSTYRSSNATLLKQSNCVNVCTHTYTQVLARTGTKQLIVGHTPQQIGINSAAKERLWRVDTAMCRLMGYVIAYVIAYVTATNNSCMISVSHLPLILRVVSTLCADSRAVSSGTSRCKLKLLHSRSATWCYSDHLNVISTQAHVLVLDITAIKTDV